MKSQQNKHKKRSIRTQLIVVLLIVALVPLAIFGWLNTQANKDNIKDYERIQQTNLAQQLRVEIVNYMNANFLAVQSVTNNINAQLSASRTGKRLRDIDTNEILYDFLQRSTNFHFIASQSLSSTIRYTFSANEFNFDKEVELQKYYREGMQKIRDSGTYLSPVLTSKSMNKTVVLYIVPVIANSNPVGFVATVIRFDPIDRKLDQNAGENYEIFVLDDNGKLISQTNINYIKDESELEKNNELVKSLFSQNEQSKKRLPVNKVFNVLIDGEAEEYLGTFTPIESLRWSLFVQLKSKIAFKPVQQMINRTFIMFFIAAMISIGVGIYFANTITKPLTELTTATNIIAEGKFDRPIEITSHNEIGLLAERFNWMSSEIQKFIINLKEAAQRNKDLFIASIRMISAAVDEKDPYTRGHSEKVREYSVEVAKLMGMPGEQVERLAISAILHDVGKIGVDDRVLKKAGTLTPEEFDLMKQHPEKGAYILSPIDDLSDVIPGILYHHEKWDGTGYPRGLKGEEIPLPARIIAVADTFDAMTSNRPYQKAMDVDYVFKLLFDWAGKRYDSQVVACMFQAYEQGKIQLSKSRSEVPIS